jgi:hypothetical protein
MDGTGLADMEITVYGRPENSENENSESSKQKNSNNYESSLSFVVSIPQKWKPNIFLAMLNKSIHEHNYVSWERVCIGDAFYFSMNEVRCYFPCELKSGHQSILRKGGYTGVFGGDSSY